MFGKVNWETLCDLNNQVGKKEHRSHLHDGGLYLEYRGIDVLKMWSMHCYFSGVGKTIDGKSGKSTVSLSGTGD